MFILAEDRHELSNNEVLGKCNVLENSSWDTLICMSHDCFSSVFCPLLFPYKINFCSLTLKLIILPWWVIVLLRISFIQPIKCKQTNKICLLSCFIALKSVLALKSQNRKRVFGTFTLFHMYITKKSPSDTFIILTFPCLLGFRIVFMSNLWTESLRKKHTKTTKFRKEQHLCIHSIYRWVADSLCWNIDCCMNVLLFKGHFVLISYTDFSLNQWNYDLSHPLNMFFIS